MISRDLAQELTTLLAEYPIVTILGPRQSGKTTLAQMVLPDFQYVNLELPDNYRLANDDPQAFLATLADRVIFDEIQRAPQLLSYLQVQVDNDKRNGCYVLTGSHQLALRGAITQSLAGRTAILTLLPFSIAELAQANIRFETWEAYCFNGFLPRIYDQQQRPRTAYANYYQTYIERDVRQLVNLKNAALFEKFMRLLAGRSGQLINYQSLANDVGVDSKTIKQWLSVLEASFVVFKLAPFYENFGKRVIKSPKYYFFDVGLLCYLLDIEKPAQVLRDPLRGNIFENLVVLELFKARFNRGLPTHLYFFRDSHGNELDVLFKAGNDFTGIEIKSATTWHADFKKGLLHFDDKTRHLTSAHVVYNGKAIEFSDGIRALPFDQAGNIV